MVDGLCYVCRFSPRMALTPVDLTIVQTTHLPHALRLCVHDIENATSHQAVSAAVLRLRSQLVAAGPTPGVSSALCEHKWMEALARLISNTCPPRRLILLPTIHCNREYIRNRHVGPTVLI